MYRKEEFINAYDLTIDQVKEEVTYLSLENIRHFPCSPSVRDNFTRCGSVLDLILLAR